MYVKQIYTNCLSQASYFISSNGQAAVIDPIRDAEVYLTLAKEQNAEIKYIFETHFHADFVSGHLDLTEISGAKIVFGDKAQCGFDCIKAADGQKFEIGNIQLQVLHTPGHTPESVCILLENENHIPEAIFTGDTVFSGDVGRPDLCQSGPQMSANEMAGLLYDSIHQKILPLSDAVLLYPGHGPGSACGKNLGPETSSSVGAERKNNYALQPMSKEEFVHAITDGIAPAPSYFFEDAAQNKNGYPLLNNILKTAVSMSVEQFKTAMLEGALVLDTRDPADFQEGFIPGAINIGLNGQFAIWAATLIELERKIILVTASGKEKESITRLARVGFNNIAGYLQDGLESWKKANQAQDIIITIDAEEFALDLKFGKDTILDVRKESELDNGHIENAKLIPLDILQNDLENLDPKLDYTVHCAGGYRSMIACSILKANGIHSVKNVAGGFAAIKEYGVEINLAK